MRQKGTVLKQQNIPLSLILVIVFLVVGIAGLDVALVRSYVRNIAEKYLDSQLVAVKSDMEENIKRTKEKASAVEALVQLAETDEEIKEVLEQSVKSSALYHFYYVKEDGTVLDDEGRENPVEIDFSEIMTVRESLFDEDYYAYCKEFYNPRTFRNEFFVTGAMRDRDQDGELRGYLMTVRPVTEVIAKEHYDNIDSVGSGCLTDADGRIVNTSDRFDDIFGKQKNAYEAMQTVTDGGSVSKNKISQMRRYLGANKTYEISCKGTDGRQVLIKGLKIDGIKDLFMIVIFDNGSMESVLTPVMLICFIACVLIVVLLFFIILLQMMVNYKNVARMEELAYTDDVTGGHNMNYFKLKAPELISTNSELHYLIMRFDIANFRYINEAYGHHSADALLRAISTKFDEVYSKKELCARINSDQFIALILNDSDTEDKNQRFEKIIGDEAKDVGIKYPVRFKKGIYQVRKEERNIDIMIDHANAARKSLKGDEKILEIMYSENIVKEMRKNDAIVSDMQPAIAKGEFKPYLQAKWDIVKDEIIGAEILVRWIKDDGTVVFPSDFIPIFEQNGFIEKLDFYMLERLCEKIREYKEKGGYRIVPVSINQSRILLGNPEYLKNVERIMTRYNTSIEDIQIEITESVFFNDREKMISVVDQLKEMGLMLCMDDFGSGYSSLNVLKDIPFDILKIDKDFFSETDTSKDTMMIMHRIIQMAGDLGIKVVCEGVETEAQIQMLKKIGCSMVQGYFYSKPIPFDEFMDKFCRIEPEVTEVPEEPEKTEGADPS
ncbi:MAG: GGDEF domain-containing protein [Lachnospiraceae bacterium]|nr:GGDEF domain-containing protein [Lachnospiraceae bacterium]